MFNKKNFILGGLVAGIVLIPAFASAQNINSIQTRLDRMEREMQTLSRSVFKGDVAPPQIGGGVDNSQTASMELRLNQIEDQLRRLTGMIEENSYRVRQVEEKMGQAPSAANTINPPSIQAQPLAPSINNGAASDALVVDNAPYQLGTLNQNTQSETPAGLYDRAFSFLRNDDYASAQSSFESFIAQYPDHSLVENAKYWLGETFYARGDYQSASRSFARAFKDHPEGSKAPDVLLKLAMSLKGQNMNEEACLTLSEVVKRFPTAQSVITKADEEKQAYGCGA